MSIGISLGYNCRPASLGVDLGWRGTKANGYKTCPFDMCISPFEGMVECIRDDFKDLVNPEYLRLQIVPGGLGVAVDEEELVYNTKYNLVFLHESPRIAANLYQTEKWPNGQYHWVIDNWKAFRERYTRRIDNFRTYLRSGTPIRFILASPNPPLDTLHHALQTSYPGLVYEITDVGCDADHYAICNRVAHYRSPIPPPAVPLTSPPATPAVLAARPLAWMYRAMNRR